MKIFAVAKKSINFAVAIFANRGVAQLAARHVRDVEVGSSSLLTPTLINFKAIVLKFFYVVFFRFREPFAVSYVLYT